MKICVITGGRAAIQIFDIIESANLFCGFLKDEIVGCVDDGDGPFYCEEVGLRVLGKTKDLSILHKAGVFDCAIVGISTSIELRERFFFQGIKEGVPFTNAIHPTVSLGYDVSMGVGNVICAGCTVGAMSKIGDNCFISANNNIEHHNVWGSHITTGPCVSTSGIVTVGDNCKFGTGIFTEAFLKIGNNCTVGSGNIVMFDVKDNMIVRSKPNMPTKKKA